MMSAAPNAMARLSTCRAPLLGGVNADFALFKNIVYTHTVTMPQVEEELGADAGRPPPPPGAPPGVLRMGNFNPTRVAESQLQAIYDWAKATSASARHCRGGCARRRARPTP